MLGLVAALLLIAGFLLSEADQVLIAGILGFPVGLALSVLCIYKVAGFFCLPRKANAPERQTVRIEDWA